MAASNLDNVATDSYEDLFANVDQVIAEGEVHGDNLTEFQKRLKEYKSFLVSPLKTLVNHLPYLVNFMLT
jgi:hypothetical protein